MEEVNNHYVVMASSEVLDQGLILLKQAVDELSNELTIDQKVKLVASTGMISTVATYLRKKKKEIEETQP